MIAKYVVPGDTIALPSGEAITVTEKSDYLAQGPDGNQLREQFEYDGGMWDCPATYEVRLIALSPDGLDAA